MHAERREEVSFAYIDISADTFLKRRSIMKGVRRKKDRLHTKCDEKVILIVKEIKRAKVSGFR